MLQGFFFLNSFFQGFLIYIKGFSCFLVAEVDFMAFLWYWDVPYQVGFFGTLIYSKMHFPFLSISWYCLLLLHFFLIILIFWHAFNIFSWKDDFGYFDWYLDVSLWGNALNAFLKCVIIYFHWLPYSLLLMLSYVYGSFVQFPMLYHYQTITRYQWNNYTFISFSTR